MRPADGAKKNIAIEEKPIERYPRSSKSRFLWFMPIILVSVFFFIFFSIIWLIQINIHTTKLNQLAGKAESTAESMRLRLKGSKDYLHLLASECSNGSLNTQLFQERASRYVANHPELINITWVDTNFVIRDVAPLASNKQILGLRLELPEPRRASHLAMKQRKPVYTQPFEAIQGKPTFEIWVPIFHGNNFLGLFAGVYSCENVLREMISPQQLKNNQVSLVDTSGTALFAFPTTEITDEKFIHRVSLTLPEKGVSLQFTGYGMGFLEHSLLLLEFLCLIFLIGIVYTIWKMRLATEASRNMEEELLDKQQMFRTLIENSPDIIARYDLDCRRTYVNPVYLKTAKIPQKKLLAASPIQFSPLPSASAESLQNLLRKVLNSGVAEAVDVLWPQEDKIIHWYNVYAFPELDHKGSVMSVMTISRDITNRKKSEEQILKLNRVYAVLSNINQLIVRTRDRQQLLNEVCRIAIEEGKFRMAWIGLVNGQTKKVDVVASCGVSGDYLKKINIDLNDEIRSKGPAGITAKTGKYKISNNIINDDDLLPWRDDAIKYDYKSVASFPLKIFGNVVGVYLIYSNETDFFNEDDINLHHETVMNISFALEAMENEAERRRAEEALQRSEILYRSVVTAMAEGVCLQAVNGEILAINPVAKKIIELIDVALARQTSNDDTWEAQIIHEDGSEFPRELHPSIVTLCTGEPQSNVIMGIHQSKDTFVWISINTQPLITPGELTPYAVATTFHDVTALKLTEKNLTKAKEKAEESDRLKSAFLANMSHEIRTPMNGILGFADLLKMPNLNGEEQQEYINIIEKSGHRMLNIINEIIDISKIESGQMNINTSESNINTQIEYIFTFFEPEAEKKGIQLSYENALPAREAFIKTDHEKVSAVLINLIKNSIKYTKKGSIEFGYKKEGKFIEFFVKDTGIGIPKNRQEAIFERFIQADMEDKMAFQGAGLGLSISKAYVEMLDGKIWVESEEGKGSIFYFTIPYTIQSEDIKNNLHVVSDENKIPLLKKLKVLIAEDDKTSEMLISIVIKNFVQEIIKVRTGTEAVEYCRNNPDIDLILMDIRMPEMNGYEATQQIRQFNKDIIIIAQTAYGLSDDREKAIVAGCNDYISKPLDIVSLNNLIQKHFT